MKIMSLVSDNVKATVEYKQHHTNTYIYNSPFELATTASPSTANHTHSEQP